MYPHALFVLLVVLGVGSSQHFAKENSVCPSNEDIKPCLCQKISGRDPYMVCSDLSSTTTLLEATKKMQGYVFTDFYLERSNMGHLPSDTFTGMTVTNLHLTFTNLTGLTEGVNRPPLLGLERSLEYLEIRECFLNENFPLSRLSLSHMKKLNTIEFNSNLIPIIGNDWFESGPYGLTELYFHDSSTAQLGSHIFAFLVNLKKVSVTGGTIKFVTRDMFPKPATNLEVIELSENELSVLPNDIFTRMPSLAEVYLENNAFSTIDELYWSPVWNQLSHVYFFGNPINCDENIKWIYKYRLPEVLGGTCSEPENRKNKNLAKLTLADFQ